MDRSDLARLLGAPGELVVEARCEATVIEAGEQRRFMVELAAATARGGTVFLADPAWGQSERDQLEKLRQLPPQTPARAAGKGWLCIPTGGTSGSLKFARHDEDTLSAAVRGFTRHFSLTRVNAVGVLPLHHVSGLMAWMRCALTGGEYRPLDWKSLEREVRPELPLRPEGWLISLVPTQLERLLRQAESVAWLRQFRLIFLGGAPAWPGLLEQAAALRLPLVLSYGMTETAAMVTALPPDDFAAGARSCGTTLPHVSLRIGPDGAIRLASEALFRGYYPHWRDAGDFEAADGGSLDASGCLHLLGRRDQVIMTGGEKVDPAEVEAVLRRSGEFSEVVVLGVPDPEWGERVVAAYPASLRPDLAKVSVVLSQSLAPAKSPKQFIALSDWPVNAQGKVNRAAVARLVRAEH